MQSRCDFHPTLLTEKRESGKEIPCAASPEVYHYITDTRIYSASALFHSISLHSLGSSPTAMSISSQSVSRLARVFTPEYVKRINAQVVHPANSVVVKPNELHSALARPMHVAMYAPERGSIYLAATLAYGLINGTPVHARLHLKIYDTYTGFSP